MLIRMTFSVLLVLVLVCLMCYLGGDPRVIRLERIIGEPTEHPTHVRVFKVKLDRMISNTNGRLRIDGDVLLYDAWCPPDRPMPDKTDIIRVFYDGGNFADKLPMKATIIKEHE